MYWIRCHSASALLTSGHRSRERTETTFRTATTLNCAFVECHVETRREDEQWATSLPVLQLRVRCGCWWYGPSEPWLICETTIRCIGMILYSTIAKSIHTIYALQVHRVVQTLAQSMCDCSYCYGVKKHVEYLYIRAAIRLVLVVSCLSTSRTCFAIRILHRDYWRSTKTIRRFISLPLEPFYVRSNSICKAYVKMSQHRTKSSNSSNEEQYSMFHRLCNKLSQTFEHF